MLCHFFILSFQKQAPEIYQRIPYGGRLYIGIVNETIYE